MKYNKRNFIVNEIGDYITLTMNKTGTVDYFTRNQTFLDILKHYKPSLEIDKQQRIRAVFYTPDEDRHDKKYFVYDIALACYTDNVHVDTFLDDMSNFIKWKNENKYTVDHADGNHRNNTVLNLSLMTREQNSAKSDLVARFVDPYAVLTVYCNGEYRIELRTRVTAKQIPGVGQFITRPVGEARVQFACKDADDYIDCLRQLYDTRFSWCNPENTPRTNQQQNSSLSYWAGDIESSIISQKMLSQMKMSNIYKGQTA